MSLTADGRARLLGAFVGQMPAPALYVQPVGPAKETAGRELVHLMGSGASLSGTVKFNPAPADGWMIGAVDIVDEAGVQLARIQLSQVAKMRPGQRFEFTLTLNA